MASGGQVSGQRAEAMLFPGLFMLFNQSINHGLAGLVPNLLLD